MPAKNRKLHPAHKFMTYGMFVVACLMPLSNLSHIYILYSLKVTEGLSLSTWVMDIAIAYDLHSLQQRGAKA